MSHFTVLVIGDDVEGQLAPYHEFECTGHDDKFVQSIDKLPEAREEYKEHQDGYASLADFIEGWYGAPRWDGEGARPKYGWFRIDPVTGEVTEYVARTNPNAHWDWWVIGGRWSGFFQLKPGRTGDLGEIGVPERFATHEARVALAIERTTKADQARKGDIDFDAMRAAAARKAADRFDRARALIGDHPIRTWEEVREEHAGDVDAARAAYWQQPAACALHDSDDDELQWSGPDEYRTPREDYIERARNGAVVTFAVVKDGQWYERGTMGWFGCVRGEKEEGVWEREFAALLDGLPDDTLLTVVDAHT